MADIQIKSGKLVAADGPKAPRILAELLPMPEGRGTIFALIKLLGRPDETREHIFEAIRDQLHRFQETLDDQANIARRFEQVLQSINERVAAVIEEGKRVPSADFHGVIGVVHKQQIFLTGAGNLAALFMHKTAKQRFSIYELDAQFPRGDALTWQKLFVTVLDGELNRGDILYVGTRVSAREINLATLQDILVMLPPAGALERIQQHLNISTAYGALCFRVHEPDEGASAPKKINPLHSIEHLGKTREDTAQTLGEQSPDFVTWIQTHAAPILAKLSAPGTRGWKTILLRTLKALVKLITAAMVMGYTLLSRLWNLVRAAFSRLRAARVGKPAADAPSGDAKPREKKTFAHLLARMRGLPKSSKYVALASIVLAALLVGSIMLGGNRKQRAQEEEAFATIVSRIEEKRDAAQASLIYEDDQQAREILTEALALLESMQPSTNAQQEEIDRLQAELNEVLTTLRGVTDVDLTSLAHLDGATIVEVVATPSGIIAVTANREAYRYDALEHQFAPLALTVGSIQTPTLATPQDDNVLIIDDAQQLSRLSQATLSLNPIISGTNNLASIEDITVYNANLYALAAEDQQIYRLRPQADGFDAGSTWIKANSADLRDARALAIDGDIYVLTGQQILKYTTGNQQDFRVDAVEPALSNPTDIWTSVESTYLYVLEPTQQRIVVYEKNGNFVTQYSAPEFAQSTSLIVQEAENSLIVATGTDLYSFPAPHLLQ